tara:strand:+ start:11561 stop:14701 length:3141 start_codon:yes stop_codon:yes gene_type:complete
MAQDNFDPLKDFAFGDLNPIGAPPSGKKYRPGETSALGALQNLNTEQYEANSMADVGPYKAICLRVESAAAGGQRTNATKLSWLDRIYSIQNAEVPEIFLEIKAMIPEIHGAMLPLPRSLGTDGLEPDHQSINRYPTFVAKSRDIALHGIPKPGDIVYVDFGNRKTLQDPVYLGPLESQLAETIALIASSDAFKCGIGLNQIAGVGDAMRPGGEESTESVGKLGPTLPANYRKKHPKLGEIPQGKGVYIDNHNVGIDIVKRFPLKVAKNAGLSWVAIKAYSVHRDGSQDIRSPEKIAIMKEFVKQYHDAGIRCYIWGWTALSVPGKGFEAAKAKQFKEESPEDLFIHNMMHVAKEIGALGIIADCEEDYFGPTEGTGGDKKAKPILIERATYLAEKLIERARSAKLCVGLSTVPVIRAHNPVEPWAKAGCDFVAPQIHSGNGKFQESSYWADTYVRYKDAGFKNIMPNFGAYDVNLKNGKAPKTPNRMRWELHAAYSKKAKWTNACVWFSWLALENRDRWSVVKEFGSEIKENATLEENKETEENKEEESTQQDPGTGDELSTTPAGGPTMPKGPADKEKETGAEVAKDKSPEKPAASSTPKWLERFLTNKDRDWAKKPVTDEEVVKWTGIEQEVYEKLKRIATDPNAVAAANVTDVHVKDAKEKIEKLREEAKEKIVDLSKQSSLKIQLAHAEKEMESLKLKQKAFTQKVQDSNTEGDKIVNSRVLADVNKQIETLEVKLVKLNASIKDEESQNPTPTDTAQCATSIVAGADSVAGSESGLDENGKVIYGATSNAQTTVELRTGEAYHYKENRVRWRVYGTLSTRGPLGAAPKHNRRGAKVHVLVAKRFDAMAEAFKKAHPESDYPVVTSGWRQIPAIRWKGKVNNREWVLKQKKNANMLAALDAGEKDLKKLFDHMLIDRYGSINAGRNMLAWYSPHSTGLAVDMYWKGPLVDSGTGTIAPGTSAGGSKIPIQRKTVLHEWLKKNAYKFGFTPYKKEPWHWEVQMPINAYKTGKEFTKTYAVYVEEKGKTGLSNNKKFAGGEFI